MLGTYLLLQSLELIGVCKVRQITCTTYGYFHSFRTVQQFGQCYIILIGVYNLYRVIITVG